MKLILTIDGRGDVRVKTEGNAEFFTITPGTTLNTYATVTSTLPGLATFDGRDVDAAVERCVELLGLWLREHIGGRVPIEVVDRRGQGPAT
ncbi:hypothetical protein [Micromonospora sp. NPDC047730]|uniref:hypothetical protein n=1 Tax=Micromonospora sp. NPDC047730 TaxID=3364253 RepID=UPI00371216B7